MKHGDKAKAKAAKASRKASDKKSSKTGGSGKKTPAVKAIKAVKATKASGAKAPAVKAGPSSAPKSAGNGRSAVEAVVFNNPTVAAAFKRAVKKYPNALRRLTD